MLGEKLDNIADLVDSATILLAPFTFLAVVGTAAVVNGVHRDHKDKQKIEVVTNNSNALHVQCLGEKALKLSYNGHEFKPIKVEHCNQTDYQP